jgi:hypothetical protein
VSNANDNLSFFIYLQQTPSFIYIIGHRKYDTQEKRKENIAKKQSQTRKKTCKKQVAQNNFKKGEFEPILEKCPIRKPGA